MSNFFLVDRGIFDHPIFARDPYSRRDAWAWLIANACYQDKVIFVNGQKITLKRGQLSFSLRFMAEKWLWPKGVAERYLTRLKTETMIETATETGQMVITIRNYDKYQTIENENRTANGTANGTAAGQQRDSSGTKKNTSIQDNTKKDIMPKPKIDFDFASMSFSGIEKQMLDKWQKAYPAVDVKNQLEKMGVWLVANPNNRKSNYASFIARWLAKAQDRAPAVGGGVAKQPTLFGRAERTRSGVKTV
jgi:hypothetical protein